MDENQQTNKIEKLKLKNWCKN